MSSIGRSGVSLRKFMADEGGASTILALYFFLISAVVAGLAIDFNKLMAERTRLQVTVDSVAHAALQLRQTESPDAARREAMKITEAMLPPDRYGKALREADIVFGRWDADTATFIADENAKEAVRVIAAENEARGNPIDNLLLHMVGIDSFNAVRDAVFKTRTDPCYVEGILAEGDIQVKYDPWSDDEESDDGSDEEADSDKEKKDKSEDDSDKDEKDKSEDDSDKEKKDKSEDDSDKEKKDKSEDDSDKEKKDKSEDDSDKDEKDKSEDDSDKDEKDKSEDDSDKDKKDKSEDDSDEEKKDKSEDDSDKEKKDKSEDDSDKDKKDKSEDDSDKDKKDKSEDDSDKEKEDKSEDDSDKEKKDKSEDDSDKDKKDESEDDSDKEKKDKSEDDSDKEKKDKSDDDSDKDEKDESEDDSDKEKKDKSEDDSDKEKSEDDGSEDNTDQADDSGSDDGSDDDPEFVWDETLPDVDFNPDTCVKDNQYVALLHKDRVPTVIENLEDVTGDNLPDYINILVPTKIVAEEIEPEDLREGAVNIVACHGNKQIKLRTGDYRNVVIVTDCRVKFDNKVTLENVIVATTSTASNSMIAAADLRIGRDDDCAEGGSAVLITEGGFHAAARMRIYGGQIIAGGDIRFAAKAKGFDGASLVAGGDIKGVGEIELGTCSGEGMDDNVTMVQAFMVD